MQQTAWVAAQFQMKKNTFRPYVLWKRSRLSTKYKYTHTQTHIEAGQRENVCDWARCGILHGLANACKCNKLYLVFFDDFCTHEHALEAVAYEKHWHRFAHQTKTVRRNTNNNNNNNSVNCMKIHT